MQHGGESLPLPLLLLLAGGSLRAQLGCPTRGRLQARQGEGSSSELHWGRPGPGGGRSPLSSRTRGSGPPLTLLAGGALPLQRVILLAQRAALRGALGRVLQR